jgi:hypothetical protein
LRMRTPVAPNLANRPVPIMTRSKSSRPRTAHCLCKSLDISSASRSAFGGLSQLAPRFFHSDCGAFCHVPILLAYTCSQGCSVHIPSSTNPLRTGLPSHSGSWPTLFGGHASNISLQFAHRRKMAHGPSSIKRSTTMCSVEVS